MNRLLLTFLFACSLVVGSLSMTGCNTLAGMSADTHESVNAVQVGPREAYHQDARDF
jgi:predicted small secreted protein